MPDDAAAPLRALFEAFRMRDAAAISGCFTDDVVWHFPGHRGVLAGDHAGRDAVLRFLTTVMTETAGTFSLELEDVLAGEEYAAAAFTGRGQRKGKTLANPTFLKVRMRDGRIAELWEFVWDLEHVEDFWG